MRVLNIGALNLDYVYDVDHIILPGETESTGGMNVFLGGKGMNQSCALAQAGVDVYHGGMIGEDGHQFLTACKEFGIHTDYIKTLEGKSGHTIIQIDKNAQNSILLYGGANQRLTEEFVDGILANFDASDILLLQNEVNLLPYIVDRAYEKGMFIILNPSPFNEKLNAVDLKKISMFLLNEVEGEQIAGSSDPDKILADMMGMFPEAKVVLTLGKEGSIYCDATQRHFQPAFPVSAVDTTAAGDTFTGYFIASIVAGEPVPTALRKGAKAAAIAVTRPGAVPSIPNREEVERALKEE